MALWRERGKNAGREEDTESQIIRLVIFVGFREIAFHFKWWTSDYFVVTVKMFENISKSYVLSYFAKKICSSGLEFAKAFCNLACFLKQTCQK